MTILLTTHGARYVPSLDEAVAKARSRGEALTIVEGGSVPSDVIATEAYFAEAPEVVRAPSQVPAELKPFLREAINRVIDWEGEEERMAIDLVIDLFEIFSRAVRQAETD